MQTILTVVLCALVGVNGHGYLTNPLARQYRCFKDGGYWWPTDGSAIPDEACRQSFNHVWHRSGTEAAQAMFTQVNEYAALAGMEYDDPAAIADHVVGKDLCSANATGLNQFGDKSGMSIVANWRRSVIEQEIEIEFCATAVHDPSKFKVYLTREGYNSSAKALEWSDFDWGADFMNPHPTPKVSPDCSAELSYKLPVKLPYRSSGTIFVWWQRIDAAGEGFYNCADFEMTPPPSSEPDCPEQPECPVCPPVVSEPEEPECCAATRALHSLLPLTIDASFTIG